MRSIPDLRDTPDISLEHCSVLLESLRRGVGIIEGDDDVDLQFIDDIDVDALLEFYSGQFAPPEFSRLFSTDFGKGILVGCFVKEVMERLKLFDETGDAEYL